MIRQSYTRNSKVETLLTTTSSSFQNQLGEFFTPYVLIDELLKEIPTHVWEDASLTWFDPCAGKGNFFLVVYYRLMKSLQHVIPHKSQRETHILKHMLFMNELNPVNIPHLRKLFGKDIHITCEDFLQMSPGKKYDIILQNPPYQIVKKQTYTGSRGSNYSLWDKFITHSFNFVNEKGGIIGCITPSNWRRTNHRLYSIITPHLKYLSIYNKKDGLEYFGAQTRFDVYLMHIQPPTMQFTGKSDSSTSTTTKIVDEKGIIHDDIVPSKWHFLPNYHYKVIEKQFSYEPQRNILYSTNEYNSKQLQIRKTKKYKYPVVHTMTRKGMGIRYSEKNHTHLLSPKVILNVNEKLYPYNDWKGEYGLSQLSFGIPIRSKKEGEGWLQKLNSKEFQEIVKATKWGSFQTDYKMFQFLRGP